MIDEFINSSTTILLFPSFSFPLSPCGKIWLIATTEKNAKTVFLPCRSSHPFPDIF
jgi:hypothetical protein